MQAPLRPKSSPSRGQEQENIEKESPSIKLVNQAIQPSLYKKTTEELIRERPFLASLIRDESLDANFFRLMDTIYFLAECLSIPRPTEGQDPLLQLAHQLPQQINWNKIPKKNRHGPLALNVIDCLPPDKQKDALRSLLRKVQQKPNFATVKEIVRRLSNKKVATFAKTEKEPTRSALYLQLIHELLKVGDLQTAKRYMDRIDLSSTKNLIPFLITIPVSLEAIFYMAEKLPNEREAFLKAAAQALKSTQDREMIEIYKHLKPGDGRDMFLTSLIIGYLNENNEKHLWIMEQLVNLITKEGLRLVVSEKIKNTLRRFYGRTNKIQ